MEEKKENLAELSDEKLDEVSGGCWFWGKFGEHKGSLEQAFTLKLSDGTHNEYAQYKCDECGNFFYRVKNIETGAKDWITEDEYYRMKDIRAMYNG